LETGLKTVILSGDKEDAVEQVAAQLGIDEYRSGVTAEEKHAFLGSLAMDGHKCAMVGDGLNDAASLAVAHASIAPASALDVTRVAADIVVLRDSFEDLPVLLQIARKSSMLARQNFAIAAIYNAVAIPIALAGLATPLIAALAMSASSLTVLLNALRVRKLS
jgi:Cu2+-exporting ATPase